MTYARNCPRCGVEITYSFKTNYLAAERKQTKCRDCALKNRRSYIGKHNPFFGQNHTNETKQKISHFNSEVRELSEEFIQTARQNLAKVSNDRPLHEIWLEKYGQEEADRLIMEFKRKQSELNKGSKNNMFGKPAPQGSGNGWSGWYKDWFFRSLRELSYMINVIEAQGLSWETPDKSFKIPYQDYAGQTRTYFPDFIIGGNRLIEIKPIKLHHTPKVLAKKRAADKFCLSQNMTYELVDPPILGEEEIKQLYMSGQIKLLDKYDQKFREKYL